MSFENKFINPFGAGSKDLEEGKGKKVSKLGSVPLGVGQGPELGLNEASLVKRENEVGGQVLGADLKKEHDPPTFIDKTY